MPAHADAAAAASYPPSALPDACSGCGSADQRWVLAVDTSAADGYDLRGQEKMLGEQRKLIVPPRTVMILVSEACPDDSENGHLLQKKKANGEKQEEKAVKEETQLENENRMVVE